MGGVFGIRFSTEDKESLVSSVVDGPVVLPVGLVEVGPVVDGGEVVVGRRVVVGPVVVEPLPSSNR